MSVKSARTRSVLDECRRFALSVFVDDTQGAANRLAGVLAWRGFRFDRVMVSDAEAGEGGSRLLLVIIDTQERVDTLKLILEAYGPVRAVRQLYAAPVICEAAA